MPVQDCERVVIVGGGFSGLAAAAQLAQSGLPVTLLEASSTLGFEASSRNQGWLHSGAWFAPEQVELAQLCYRSLRETVRFCPHCIEPDHEGMYFVASQVDSDVKRWTHAWKDAGIPFEEAGKQALLQDVPGINPELAQRVFRLPDRAFRPDVLLDELAAAARNAGAEIRTGIRVTRLLKDDALVEGVVTGRNEEIRACHVILATGALSEHELVDVGSNHAGLSDVSVVPMKTHLVAVQPDLSRMPFCFIDRHGFNHVPHERTSVFNSGHWRVVSQAGDTTVEPAEIEAIWTEIEELFPELDRAQLADVREWAGTTAQAMGIDQVEPGVAPRPTIIDHEEHSGLKNVWSIYPGRATLWSVLAEQVRERLLTRLDRTPTTPMAPPWAIDHTGDHV
jgi:glycine/D-amino acid oxidase-like deaminating enzyme